MNLTERLRKPMGYTCQQRIDDDRPLTGEAGGGARPEPPAEPAPQARPCRRPPSIRSAHL